MSEGVTLRHEEAGGDGCTGRWMLNMSENTIRCPVCRAVHEHTTENVRAALYENYMGTTLRTQEVLGRMQRRGGEDE